VSSQTFNKGRGPLDTYLDTHTLPLC